MAKIDASEVSDFGVVLCKFVPLRVDTFIVLAPNLYIQVIVVCNCEEGSTLTKSLVIFLNSSLKIGQVCNGLRFCWVYYFCGCGTSKVVTVFLVDHEALRVKHEAYWGALLWLRLRWRRLPLLTFVRSWLHLRFLFALFCWSHLGVLWLDFTCFVWTRAAAWTWRTTKGNTSVLH